MITTTFSYQCRTCGEWFDAPMPVTKSVITECPVCKQTVELRFVPVSGKALMQKLEVKQPIAQNI